MRPLLRLLLRGLALTLSVALLAEGAFRAFYPDDGEAASTIVDVQRRLRSGTVSRFVPHPYLSYVFAAPSTPSPSDPINPLGFRGPDPRSLAAGTKRIVCAGADTTLDHFAALATALRDSRGDSVAPINYAVPGWTTAESALNLMLNASHHPNAAVVIHHAPNDTGPRLAPGFQPDYSHWRRPFVEDVGAITRWLGRYSQLFLYAKWLGGFRDFGLERAVVPHEPLATLDPATASAFDANLRTMITACETFGAHAIVATVPRAPGPPVDDADRLLCSAIDEHNAIGRTVASSAGATLLDLAARFSDPVDFESRTRMTGPALQRKARMIADAVFASGALDR